MLDVENRHQGLLDVTWVRRVSCILLSLVGSFLSVVDGGDSRRSGHCRSGVGLGKVSRCKGRYLSIQFPLKEALGKVVGSFDAWVAGGLRRQRSGSD